MRSIENGSAAAAGGVRHSRRIRYGIVGARAMWRDEAAGGESIPVLAGGERCTEDEFRDQQPAGVHHLARARPVRGAHCVLRCARPLHNVRACLIAIAPKWSNSASWLAVGRGRLQDMLRDRAVILALVQHKMVV